MALVLVAAAAACGGPRTAVVVVVESDLAAPAEVASVRASVGAGACGDGLCVHDFALGDATRFPFSFVLEPRGAADARFALTVAARDGVGAEVVARSVETAFVPGRTLRLRIALERACRAATCAASDTCVAGACVARAVDPATLPDVVPGRELDGLGDAGPPQDAGLPLDAPPDDAPIADAPRSDAPLPLLTACSDLPVETPSGTYEIDPDGAGGAAPFDAWCENGVSGGGWTLLAKVEPTSTALSYTSTRWLASTPMPIGIADDSPGDALLLPYWVLPVEELLVRSAAGSFVTEGVPRVRGTLRAAMGAAGGTVLAAGLAEWSAVVPGLGTGTTACLRSGLDVALPGAGPEIRVRVGLVGGPRADCTDPAFWYGLGAHVAVARSTCVATTSTAGGGRVCGPPAARVDLPQLLFLYGR